MSRQLAMFQMSIDLKPRNPEALREEAFCAWNACYRVHTQHSKIVLWNAVLRQSFPNPAGSSSELSKEPVHGPDDPPGRPTLYKELDGARCHATLIGLSR